MTGRQRLARRVAVIRRLTYIGLGLYFVPALGAYFFPWIAFLAVLGVVLSGVALVLAFRSFRCVQCGQKLGNLLVIGQPRRLFALPENLPACPHCGFEFDIHRDHEGLTEILGGYDADGGYLGVVGVPLNGSTVRYELALQRQAREAFERILQLRPFGKTGGTTYRYFFVPPSEAGGQADGHGMTLRVEQGDRHDAVHVPAPPSLVATLAWLSLLPDADQVTGVHARAEADS